MSLRRIVLFVLLLAGMGASAYTFVDRAGTGRLNPAAEVDAAATRGELASAQYVLGIVAGEMARLRVIEGTFDGQLDFDSFPLVTLVRADELSYCLEFEKAHTYFLSGPGGTVAPGTC